MDNFSDYWKQHIRWSGNLSNSAFFTRPSHGASVGIWRTVETWVLTRGYADRIVLLAVSGFVALGTLPMWIPLLYLATIAGNVMTALFKARTGRKFPGFFFSTLAFYAIDIVASLGAVVAPRAPGPYTPPRTDT